MSLIVLNSYAFSRAAGPEVPQMDKPGAHELTQLLEAWSDGEEEALEKLAPLVHAELYRLAKRYMSRERPDHLLQTSALINEAYVRLIDWKAVRWQNRAHFFGVAAQIMRRILVDFARRRPRADKDAEAIRMSLDEAMTVSSERDRDLLALDEALKSLAEIDERKSQIVEMRFFGGLSVDETAEAMRISSITVIREWNKAKAWLYRELSAPGR
jgi:RNA polymerase sigma factor (TIGR02999 family)